MGVITVLKEKIWKKGIPGVEGLLVQ